MLNNRTIIITGASRGIGREMALRFAKDGANIVVVGKTKDPHPKLPGTILEVAAEVTQAGGNALAIQADIRYEDQVTAVVEQTVERFGGVDVLVNNAGAIQLSTTEDTPMKRFDLMHGVNVRGVFLCVQKCLPHLKKSNYAHVLSLSPPFSGFENWLAPHLAYSLSKYGMTMCTMGMAKEFKDFGICVNSLWPKRLIATAATRMLMGEAQMMSMRSPKLMADAAYEILCSREGTGQCLLDEQVMANMGVVDLKQYDMTPGQQSPLDLFIND